MVKILFWLLSVIIIYVYFGYPLLLVIISKFNNKIIKKKGDIEPSVSIIIAAYNEEKVIAQKIENSLALDYPRNRLEIIVASDGSTDHTNEIVSTFASQGVKLVALNSNQGKSNALNQGVVESTGDILFFSDADITLRSEALCKICRNFTDEKVGCIISKIKYINESNSSVNEGEVTYWRYELFLRNMESRVGNFTTGSGTLAIRRSLFHPIDSNSCEDFVLPIQTALAGSSIVYEPEAIAETPLCLTGAKDMFQAKLRVILSGLQSLFLHRFILNPLRYPLYTWELISHKLLRWLVPYFLIALFAINVLLLGQPFYKLTLSVQIVFYILALLGYMWQKKVKPPRILSIPFYFCLINGAALVGVGHFLFGKKSGRWKPVRTIENRTDIDI